MRYSYKLFTVVFFNTVLFFFLINLAAHTILLTNSKKDYFNEVIERHIITEGFKTNNYDLDISDNYIINNVKDMVSFNHLSYNEFMYYPYIENVHSNFSSKNINIITLNNDLPKRKSLNHNCNVEKSIYCFGGSTTFGYLVSDEHTWPSFLSKELNSLYSDCFTISNYATNGYTPSQETFQFIELIKLGHRPSAVIFLDGLNVGAYYSGGEFSKKFAKQFNNHTRSNLGTLIQNLPVIKLIRKFEFQDPFSSESGAEVILALSENKNKLVSNRLIFNAELRNMIGEKYGIKVINILQPNAFYKNNYINLNKNLDDSFLYEIENNYKSIYSNIISTNPLLFFDLSDLNLIYNSAAYIDMVHYSPEFNLFLAREVIKKFPKDLNNFYIDSNRISTNSFF